MPKKFFEKSPLLAGRPKNQLLFPFPSIIHATKHQLLNLSIDLYSPSLATRTTTHYIPGKSMLTSFQYEMRIFITI